MLIMKKTRFTTYVTQDVYDKLRELSKETRVPIAGYIQEALEDLLDKYDKPIEK